MAVLVWQCPPSTAPSTAPRSVDADRTRLPPPKREPLPGNPGSAETHRRSLGDRHDRRVLRLLHLRHRIGAGVQHGLLPPGRPAGRDARGVLHLRRRVLRPSVRRDLLGLGRRPRRTQTHAGPHAPAHRDRHVRGGPDAHVRRDRHLGRGHPRVRAAPSGLRRRRRAGRSRAAHRGGLATGTPRIRHQLRAARLPRRLPHPDGVVRRARSPAHRRSSSCPGAGAFRSCSAPWWW